MPKKLGEHETPAREKSMVRIHPNLHRQIKVLAAMNDAEIGILTENLLVIGLKEFEKDKGVAA
jgi:predicted HicB family RNase H-like nuclease